MFKVLAVLANLVLIVYALRSFRWAYLSLLFLAIFYFPASVGFKFTPGPIDLNVDLSLVVLSLQNYRHIVMFSIFFIMTCFQINVSGIKRLLIAAAITMLMGVWVETAQWFTGNGHCRLRDLIPDAIGVLVGAIFIFLKERFMIKSK